MEKRKSVLKITLITALFSALIILLPVLLTPQGDVYVQTPEPVILETVTPELTLEERQANLRRPPQLTREQFLEDFDYLMQALEENFPTFGIVYRREGVDLRQLGADLREHIADPSTELDYVVFWHILRTDFFDHAQRVGHLSVASYNFFQDTRGVIPWSLTTRRTYDYFGELLRLEYQPPDPDTHLLETRIIEDGRIAFLYDATLSFRATPEILEENKLAVDEFYSQIAGFEHLIIDIRDITGGFPRIFKDAVVSPLINEPMETTFHHFYKDGAYNRPHMRGVKNIFEIHPFNLEDVEEIFPNVTLSDDVLADLSNMDFYFPRTFTIYPDPERTASFNGKVWLLVNYNNFSATQHIASLFHQTDFATLVGETTGGAAVDGGIGSQYFYLPNTGFLIRYDTAYIVSADGRPWEYGTQPHHFNREGMDALETVLALIAEGNY
ncbi:MAG: S41 family peptidase [Defluviitaleaceae bacterium]|nr:S41 family peptidase [Defluviitaleaceae bacterium]